jgi:type IV pilus assembly protein PilW
MIFISSQQKQNGLTLIELLIAMLLGTLMILGATSMFTANKRIYKEVDFQGRLAENARFAMEMIIRDLRMTGFVGCAIQQDVINNLNVLNGAIPDPTRLLSFMTKTQGTGAATVQTNSIEGSESGGAWQPSGSTDATVGGTAVLAADTRVATFGNQVPVTMLTTSDGFTVRFLEDTNTNLCANMADPTSLVVAQAQAGATIGGNTFLAGGVYAVADCEATNIFQLNTNQPTTPFNLDHTLGGLPPGNISNALSKQYTISDTTNCSASPVDVMIFRARRYFVATDPDGNFPALYRQVFNANPNNPAPGTYEEYAERLIDGVVNMQILYGQDTTGNRVPNTYLTATAVTSWANVVSVKLALLFATVNEDFTAAFDVAANYQLLNAAPFDPTPAANDRRRRRIVEATVSLRNRQLSLN